jgi:hypothetical protein
MQQSNPIAGRFKGGIEPYPDLVMELKDRSRRRGPPYPSVQRQPNNGFTIILPHCYCMQTLLNKLAAAVRPHHPQ